MVGLVGSDIPAGKDYDLVIDNALNSANLTGLKTLAQAMHFSARLQFLQI